MDGPARFRVSLLDGFALRVGPALDAGPGPPPRAVQRLVAYLALASRPGRATVAARLRPDASEDHASGSLRSALWRTQRLAPGLVEAHGDTLRLAHDARVDVAELAGWARRVLDPAGPVEVPPSSVTGSELLPGWDEDWVVLERERIRQLTLHAWEAAAQKLVDAARYGEAVEAAYAAVRAEPLRASAHRTLMRVHLAEGNAVEAARVYSAFRTMLAAEEADVRAHRSTRTARS